MNEQLENKIGLLAGSLESYINEAIHDRIEQNCGKLINKMFEEKGDRRFSGVYRDVEVIQTRLLGLGVEFYKYRSQVDTRCDEQSMRIEAVWRKLDDLNTTLNEHLAYQEGFNRGLDSRCTSLQSQIHDLRAAHNGLRSDYEVTTATSRKECLDSDEFRKRVFDLLDLALTDAQFSIDLIRN